MIRIQIFKKMSESLKKKGIRSQVPFPFFFNNKMEHPRVEKERRKKQEKTLTLSFIEEA